MKLLFIISLLFSQAYAQQQMFHMMNQSATQPLILDSVSGDMASYGLRTLHANYTGPLVRVRRSTDNTETDISGSSSGLDVSAFSAFIGAGNGFVTVWYDQSGNGKNATQTTTSLQPQLELNIVNGKPAMTFTGNRYLAIPSSTSYFANLHSTQGTITAVAKAGNSADPNALYALVGNNSITGAKVGLTVFYDDRAGSSQSDAFRVHVTDGLGGIEVVNYINQNAVVPNTWSVFNAVLDPDNVTAANRVFPYVDNTALTANNSSAGTASVAASTTSLQIGAEGAAGFMWVGYISEVIIHSTSLSSGNINILNANINRFYAVY